MHFAVQCLRQAIGMIEVERPLAEQTEVNVNPRKSCNNWRPRRAEYFSASGLSE